MKEVTRKGTAVGVPARREEVIGILNDSYARDLIEMEEFEERMDVAQGARYREELDQLVADLPVAARPGEPEVPAGGVHTARVILGEKRLAGNWLAGRQQADFKSILSTMVVDCRELDLPPGVTTLQISNILGHFELIIPPGLTVENQVQDVLSSVVTDPLLNRVKKGSDAVLRLTGRALLGSMSIKVK